jgi:hypothetical protein
MPSGDGWNIPVTVKSEGIFAIQGRVEVRKNGIWGTICNDNTDEDNWLNGQASHDGVAIVICRQMGWKIGRLLELSIVTDGTNQIWMDNLNCDRTETHLEQCNHNDKNNWQWGTHNCNHAQDIGVGCDMWDNNSKYDNFGPSSNGTYLPYKMDYNHAWGA